MSSQFDVVVIGSGGAGLCAAIEARRQGASVVVLEAADVVGGSTALSGGVVMAAGTSLQRAHGVADDADAFYERYMVLNRWSIEPSLARALCQDAGAVVEWLIELGVEFQLLAANSAEYTPRGHMAAGEGAKIARTLELEAQRLGASIRLGSRVTDLQSGSDGWSLTVSPSEETLHARSVVIASGGIARSRELLDKYYPDVAAHGEAAWTVSAPTCVGDGLLLGQEAGADITGQNQGLALITPGFAQNFDVVPPAWLVFVNREGRRYVDELMPYSMLTETTHAQKGGTAFALLDESARLAWAPTDLTHQGVVSLDWNRDSIAENVETGKVIRADSLRELAERASIDAAALEQTIATYNADCAAGRDSHFFKDPEWMRPVSTPPFYAAEIRPCLIALTCCGLRIDADARVLRPDQTPIEGLYAAGETTGGAMRQYGGSGNSIANALVFGLRAGRSAAEKRG
jgi:fumarate reductase flavoprotein subunit